MSTFNRRNFLAIIPSLSALPFIGTHIIKEKDRIIIEQPKAIEVVQEVPSLSDYDKTKLQFLLVYDGEVIGSASNTEVGMAEGRYMETALSVTMVGRPRFEVRAEFNENLLVENLYRALRSRS